MKFSTRCDTEIPAPALFEAVADPARFERMLRRRGASVSRKASDSVGTAWDVGFDWRGRAHDLSLEVTRLQPSERLSMAGQSESLEVIIDMTVVALSKTRARLIVETELRPRNMRARLMLQTAKLGKSQLDRKFARRISDMLAELTVAV